MNCISEEHLQKYIDNELDLSEKAQVEKHLSTCSLCTNNYNQRKEFVNVFIQTMNSLTAEHIVIPPLKIAQPEKQRNNRSFKRLIYSLSAACILAFAVLIIKNRPTDDAYDKYMALPQTGVYVDANSPVTEQQMVIQAVGPDGQVAEYYIE